MNEKPLIQVAGELREMNDSEFAQYLKDKEESNLRKIAAAEAAAARAALLAKLGITEEEAKLLLS